MKPNLTKEQIESLYREHISWRKVARHLGIRESRLFEIRTELGVTLGYTPHKDWSHLTVETLDELYDRFRNWGRVAEHLEIDRASLHHVRKRLGMNIPPPGTSYPGAENRKKPSRLDDKVDRIRELAGLGWSCAMIADAIDEPNPEHVRRRMVREGIPRRSEGAMHGKLNHCWKGGRREDGDGYILVPAPEDHPGAKSNGYIYEHRLIAEEKIGRHLCPEEVVHHIDGDKTNNHPDNLQVFANNGEHLSHEWSDPTWAQHQSEIRKKVIEAEESLAVSGNGARE